MKEVLHTPEHDELEGNGLSALTPELVAHMQKVGGQEYGRLAFTELCGSPKIDVVTMTLMQKAASVSDLELYKSAEQACPEDALQLYEQLGGTFKIAGVADRAKGFKRVGELLSGSRAKALHGVHEEASEAAGKHMMDALRGKHHPDAAGETMKRIDAYAKMHKVPHQQAVRDHAKAFQGEHMGPSKMRDNLLHAYHMQENKIQATKASRIGKVLKAEEHKVRTARGVTGGAVAGGVAVGVDAHRHKNSDKK